MSSAELFLKYNYPETKELCLHFLTLITAVLVFSLNFAEKAIDFQHSAQGKRLVIIMSWCLLVLAIVFCGLGLVFNSLAAGDAVYQKVNYLALAQKAYLCMLAAGTSFVLGLILMMIAAISTKARKTPHSTPTSSEDQ